MTPDLAAIEARCAAATPGSWEWEDYHNLKSPSGYLGFYQEASPYMPQVGADMEFIAHARTDLPALLTRVRQLEAVREAAEKVLPYLSDHAGTITDLVYRPPAEALRHAADEVEKKASAVNQLREALGRCEA